MDRGKQRTFLAVVFLFLTTPHHYAHSAPMIGDGQSSGISGVVRDTASGGIPGATVVITSNATETKFEVVTNSTGAFSVPALPAGVYTVTASLQGFKTAAITDVRVQPGVPTFVQPVLEVGTVAETITVTGSSAEIINTQTPTVAATLNVDQIAQIPTPTRDVLNAVTYMVGVNQTGVARGNATVNGLPESFLNITLDGVSNNDNFNKSTDGFFAPVRPRQDAIEAVTVTTAAGGADVGGHGAVSINFVTRQGSNRFTGSAYEYFRDSFLNTNYWFNIRDGLDKNAVTLNQFGVRQGGPIVIPGLYDGRGKAFFFVHFERLHLPNDVSRVRTVTHPSGLNGVFRYTGAGGAIIERNVLDLARQNGQISTVDPTVMRILTNIQTAVQKSGVLNATSDPFLVDYSWLSPAMQTESQPAIRIDYNLGDKHRLTGTFNKLWQDRNPDQLNDFDRNFPDAPNYRHTVVRRPSRSLSMRSTLSSSIVNEMRVGVTVGERLFFGQEHSNGPQTYDDMRGYAIDLDGNIGLTNWHDGNTMSGRSAWQYTVDETLTWQKGKHSVTAGGGIFLGRAYDDSRQVVPGINLGFSNANDPAAGMFNTTNFPGASGNQLTDARELYGLLTGRVIAVTGLAALDPATNTYSFLGKRRREGKLNNYSLFLQDSWRVTPTLTINGGLRWDVQTPFAPTNDTMSAASMADVCGMSGLGDGGIYSTCRFNDPTATGGKTNPEFVQFTSGTRGWSTDWNNVAPNVGIAWRPNVQSGLLRTLLGDPEQATLRGGYSVAYERQGFAAFTGVFGPNPGSTLSLTRDANTGLVPPGESWPVLLSETHRLYPAPFPERPTYPIPARSSRQDDMNAFHPDIQVANARTWTVGLQRAITRNMALEVRYVGTRGVDQWSTLNYNALNIVENGFLQEFQRAVANLRANNAAGGNRAGSFAYFGPGSGTSPLPIYFAYLLGRGDPNNSALYTGNTWTNTALTNDMVFTRPEPFNSAGDLDNDNGRRNNALAAGLPANLFVVNPALDDVNVTDSGAYSDYNALQVELRRRLSRGVAFNASYQYAIEGGSAFLGFRDGRVMNPTANVRHAIKTQWDWTLPVGRGERYGSNMHPVLNGLLGGWQFTGAGRIQARMVNFGNVRLVGMTKDDLQDMYGFDIRINPDNGLRTPYLLPDDVILNTRRAFSTSPTSPTGYSALGVPEGRYIAPANSETCMEIKDGDCAPRALLVRAPFFTRIDIGVTKRFPIRGSMNFELRVDVLNLFDNVNFDPTADDASVAAGDANIFRATEAYRDPDNNFDPGGRLGQLSFRINW